MPNLYRKNTFNKEEDIFEPSSDAKKSWLMTRKETQVFGGGSLPGLFNTDKYSRDFLFFTIALVFEFIGLWIIWQASGGDPDFIYLVLVAVAVDVFFAIALHYFVGQENKLKNDLAIWSSFQKKNTMKSKLGKPKPKTLWNVSKFLFGGLILFFAFAKMGLYWILIGGVLDTTGIGIMATYMFVAYVHIFHTGYFLGEVLVNNYFFGREYKKFISLLTSEDNEQNKYLIEDYRLFYFFSDVKLNAPISIDGGRHHIEEVDRVANNGNNYRFKTWGILDDSDLMSLVDKQTSTASKVVVGVNGHAHQMQILERDAEKESTHGNKTINLIGDEPTNPSLDDKVEPGSQGTKAPKQNNDLTQDQTQDQSEDQA